MPSRTSGLIGHRGREVEDEWLSSGLRVVALEEFEIDMSCRVLNTQVWKSHVEGGVQDTEMGVTRHLRKKKLRVG